MRPIKINGKSGEVILKQKPIIDLIFMQRPKWLSGWGEGKNLFESCLLIDMPDIKVVEASFNKRLFFFAVGTTQENETPFSPVDNDKGKAVESKTDLKWKIFYDSSALPQSMAIGKAKDLMLGIVSASTGNTSVYNPSTAYVASGNRSSRGNLPVLIDYELAKKIEEARKKKTS